MPPDFPRPPTGIHRARLRQVVCLGVCFLDNAIDVCDWPLPEIDETVKRTRPVGLGVMGFADLCLKLGIRYGSDWSAELMDELLGFVRREAWLESLRLGKEKGSFPEATANRDAYAELLFDGLCLPRDLPLAPRNHQVTMAEPSATVAMVAETSSGIEPNFAWACTRNDAVGMRVYVHPLAAQALGVYVDLTDDKSIARAADIVLARQRQPATALRHRHVDLKRRTRGGARRSTAQRRQRRFKDVQWEAR